MDWSKLLENKDIRSALIALISAVLTWATDAVAAWSGTSLGALAPAVMAAWAVAVNAVQTRVRQWLADSADDAAADELRKSIEDRTVDPAQAERMRKIVNDQIEQTIVVGNGGSSEGIMSAAKFVESYEPRTLDPNFPPSPPPRLQTFQDLAGDGSRPLVVLAFLAGLLGCSAVGNAAPPRAIITGPNTGTPGEFITLDASTSEGDPKHYRWSISPELRGRKQLLPTMTGERCTVASFPGRYVVTLAVANDDGIDSLTWQIEIPGQVPCPPPEPQPIDPQPVVPIGPTPIPQPVQPVTPVNPQPVDNTPPPGEFGIAPDVYRAALAATSPTRVQDCQRLASECRRIAGGQADSLNALATQMVAVLVTLPAGWDSLKSKVKTTVATLAVSGRIKSAADMQRLLLELADAFERAAR